MTDAAAVCPATIGTRTAGTANVKTTAPITANVTYAVRHPWSRISRCDRGTSSSVPQPLPAATTPRATVRRFTNNRPTVAVSGAVNIPLPSPTPVP